jgi:hypothetical protein
VDVHTIEVALSMVHHLVFSKRHLDILTSNKEGPLCYREGLMHVTVAGCVSLAIKFCQTHAAPFDELWTWVRAVGGREACAASGNLKVCTIFQSFHNFFFVEIGRNGQEIFIPQFFFATSSFHK